MTNRQRNTSILFVIAVVVGGAFFVSTAGGAHETPMPRCTAIQREVQMECAQMQENQWYDGGSVDYLRQDRLKDIPRCEHLAANIFHFCSNPP